MSVECQSMYVCMYVCICVCMNMRVNVCVCACVFLLSTRKLNSDHLSVASGSRVTTY